MFDTLGLKMGQTSTNIKPAQICFPSTGVLKEGS